MSALGAVSLCPSNATAGLGCSPPHPCPARPPAPPRRPHTRAYSPAWLLPVSIPRELPQCPPAVPSCLGQWDGSWLPDPPVWGISRGVAGPGSTLAARPGDG